MTPKSLLYRGVIYRQAAVSPKLAGLANLARYYHDDFEGFAEAYFGGGGWGRYWHITDKYITDPPFTLDRKKKTVDQNVRLKETSRGAKHVYRKGLWVTSCPQTWYKESRFFEVKKRELGKRLYRSFYTVEIDISKLRPNVDYFFDKAGDVISKPKDPFYKHMMKTKEKPFYDNGQVFIKNLGRAKIVKELPIASGMRAAIEYGKLLPKTVPALQAFWEEAQT